MKHLTQFHYFLWLAFLTSGCASIQDETIIANQGDSSITAINDSKNMKSAHIGKFIYMADAAVFEDCLTSRKFSVRPVIQSDEQKLENNSRYHELERYYLKHATDPGKAIFIELEGFSTRKPAKEEGLNDIIIPNRFTPLTQSALKKLNLKPSELKQLKTLCSDVFD